MALSFHELVFYSQMKFCSIKHFKYYGNNNNNSSNNNSMTKIDQEFKLKPMLAT